MCPEASEDESSQSDGDETGGEDTSSRHGSPLAGGGPGDGGPPSVGGGSTSRRPRFRGWCFTINNWDVHDRFRCGALVPGEAEWLCYQPELAPGTGTPHLQGAVSFKHPRDLGGVKRSLGPRVHLEPMAGSAEQSRVYCSKAESRDPAAGFGFVEFGKCPVGLGKGRGARTDAEGVVSLLRSGGSFAKIAEIYPSFALRCSGGVLRVQAALARGRDFKTQVSWYWGPTGTGKTRAAFEEAGSSAYFKMSGNRWWDGYEGQETVVVDDYRRDFSTFSELLRIFDRYPLRVEAKGSSTQFVAKRIWITTPKDPTATWEGRTGEEISQLLRRIEVIKHFPGDVVEVFPLFVPGFVPGN